MNDTVPVPTLDLVRLSGEVVAAFVSRNAVPAEALPDLMSKVHAALVALAAPARPAGEEQPALPSATEIKRSVKPEGITSFLDGRSYKVLTRHLSINGYTASTYKARFGLPQDYPMTAPAYAARRSELAKAIGLGQLRQRQDAAPPPALVEATSPAAEPTAKPKRGRPPNAQGGAAP